jgi:hypothetical protein
VGCAPTDAFPAGGEYVSSVAQAGRSGIIPGASPVDRVGCSAVEVVDEGAGRAVPPGARELPVFGCDG